MAIPANLIGLPLGDLSAVGSADTFLRFGEVEKQFTEILESLSAENKRVLLIVPDATRSCPLPQLLPLLHNGLAEKASEINVLIALGTHAAMKEKEIDKFFAGEGKTVASEYPNFNFLNHEWWKPETFANLGTIPAERVREISYGRLDKSVPVLVNKLVIESDLVLILGPVFPHEVVGFSGGAKYLFPGVSGKEMIDNSHWLGALITSSEIIGTLGITPVREMINEAASYIKSELFAICLVVASGSGELHAISFGRPHSAWEIASAISSKTHIRYFDKPVKRVLSLIPEKYNDIWVAAKGMYKVEPIIADGGEVIIYAPHVTEFSYSHPELAEIGYHCKEFFVKQWEKYGHFPAGLLAHSTHLRGAGTFDEFNGEQLRIKVTLATGIPEASVRAMNLNYLDPKKLDIAQFEKDNETLVLPNAGEILCRLNS